MIELILKNIKKVLKIIYNAYKLLYDAYNFNKIIVSSLWEDKVVYLINHRNWGFGHQLIELRYSRLLIKREKAIIICRRYYGNRFLHNRMIDKKWKTIEFYYPFYYDIACQYIRNSRKSVDIGTSPDEPTCDALQNNNNIFTASIIANNKLSTIYSHFIKQAYYDVPTIFTKRESHEIERQLKNIGLKENTWFVNIHIRNTTWSNIRNTNINSYQKSIDYIKSIGGQVIITGIDLELNNDLIYIDQKTDERLQLYILKHQKFLICTCSGPSNSSFIFDVPVIVTNLIFWEFFTWSHKDSILPKLILDKRKDELINTSTYLRMRKDNMITLENIDSNFQYIDNDPEEILDSVKQKFVELETNDYTLPSTQSKFRKQFDDNYYIHKTFSKIDDGFYLKYQKIFEN